MQLHLRLWLLLCLLCRHLHLVLLLHTLLLRTVWLAVACGAATSLAPAGVNGARGQQDASVPGAT